MTMMIKSKTEDVLTPFLLQPMFVERVWGVSDLAPWYPEHPTSLVGEVWLTADNCMIASGDFCGLTLADAVAKNKNSMLGSRCDQFPLLIKLLFPANHLSVQVHPDDALAAELGPGVHAKSECWYALSASSEAQVALGLKVGTTEGELKAALGRRELEDLLQHCTVQTGDMINVPAGTVHAIGPGMVLLEVQQPSDITYRLWDYGRPRELHLAEGFRAIKLVTAAGYVEPVPQAHGVQLISAEHFIIELYEIAAGDPPLKLATENLPQAIVSLAGSATLTSGVDGDTVSLGIAPGSAAIVPASVGEYGLAGPCVAVRCRIPS